MVVVLMVLVVIGAVVMVVMKQFVLHACVVMIAFRLLITVVLFVSLW